MVAELAEHGLLATGDNPNPRTLAYPDLGKLTYLQAVIKVCPSTCSREPATAFDACLTGPKSHACVPTTEAPLPRNSCSA